MSSIVVYLTAKDAEEGRGISRALVQDNLAACVNLFPGVESCYRWEGKIEMGQEVVLIVKTDSARLEDLITKVKSMHSYSVPCVTSWPITGGNPDFLAWIERESARA